MGKKKTIGWAKMVVMGHSQGGNTAGFIGSVNKVARVVMMGSPTAGAEVEEPETDESEPKRGEPQKVEPKKIEPKKPEPKIPEPKTEEPKAETTFQVATWVTGPFKTAKLKYYVFVHTDDPRWEKFQLVSKAMKVPGAFKQVDGESPPFDNAHRLKTSAKTNKPHGAPVKNEDYVPVWRYLMGK